MLDWLWIEFYNLYWFAFYWVISVSWSRFDRLNWVDSGFFLSLFNRFFSSILFLNIGLIENWSSICFLIYFISGYHDFMIWVVDFTCELGSTRVDPKYCYLELFLIKLCFFFLIVWIAFGFAKLFGWHQINLYMVYFFPSWKHWIFS